MHAHVRYKLFNEQYLSQLIFKRSVFVQLLYQLLSKLIYILLININDGWLNAEEQIGKPIRSGAHELEIGDGKKVGKLN